jgi:hypothetical protein
VLRYFAMSPVQTLRRLELQFNRPYSSFEFITKLVWTILVETIGTCRVLDLLTMVAK